jgi:predicted nucleic acid-binding protein
VTIWLEQVHSWLTIAQVLPAPDPKLSFLGLGEREAIAFAEAEGADLILMDEIKGRKEAKLRG